MGDERSRVEAIRAYLHRDLAHVVVGIGDDAAVLTPSRGSQVLTVDAAVEGVHFRRGYASWRMTGRRALVAAASDIAAMGAFPRAALIALALPRDMPDEDLMDLVGGLGDGASECGAPIVGGNLSTACEVSVTTTVVGEVEGAPLLRSGARPGDGVYVTGTVGGAALGLALLSDGRGDDPDPRARLCVDKWRRPHACLLAGQRLRGHATAAIDISDGLLEDLGHLCEASEVGAEVYVSELPVLEGLRDLGAELGLDGIELALTGGEDYELVFTAPAGEVARQLGTRIGLVTARAGDIAVVDHDGARVTTSRSSGRRGYRHFT